MLVATRDDDYPRAGAHFAAAPPRTLATRFTSGIQLLGSLIGIPLALIGGYSTYHANFSPEAKCQALRANIVAMLDKKADASTLRMLVHRDVVTFERDCGLVDAEAVTAFKTLLAAEKKPAARHAESPRTKETAAERPAKPAKSETAAKTEPPKPAPAPVKHEAGKTVVDAKPVTVAAAPDGGSIDAAWVNSVREALRESAARPAAAQAAPELAAPMPAPIVVPGELKPAGDETEAKAMPQRPDHPVPPAPIPNIN